MIKRIELKNFECHVDTTLDLVNGLNVIVGLSDHGKSSIRRAIEWVLFNRPNDTSMLRKKGVTRVIITLSDGNIVERFRSRSKNGYKLNDTVFTALRRSVPDEISQLFNLSTTNVQPQLEHYFMLELTAGKVAKKLNEVTNLQISDDALEAVSERIRSNRRKLKTTEERIDYLVPKIKQLGWAIPATKLLESYDTVERRRSALEETVSKGYRTLETMDRLSERISRLSYVDQAALKIEIIAKLKEKYFDALKDKRLLESTISDVYEARKILHRLGDVEARWQYICLITDTLKNLQELIDLRRNVSSLLTTINHCNSYINHVDKVQEKSKAVFAHMSNLSKATEEYKELKKLVLTIRACRNFMAPLAPEQASTLVEEIDRVLEHLYQEQERFIELQKAVDRASVAKKMLSQARARAIESENKFERYLQAAGVCPLCGRSTEGAQNATSHNCNG